MTDPESVRHVVKFQVGSRILLSSRSASGGSRYVVRSAKSALSKSFHTLSKMKERHNEQTMSSK